jgi:hypothetical protein
MRQLSLFKGKNQRGVTLPPPKEFALHCVLADLLKRWCSKQWRYTHLPMGEYRDKITAARLKRMGVTPGWPDFLFVGPGQVVFLELKRQRSGRMSDEQTALMEHLCASGCEYLVSDNIKAAVAILATFGILPSTITVQ